jgi:hypothetical protein
MIWFIFFDDVMSFEEATIFLEEYLMSSVVFPLYFLTPQSSMSAPSLIIRTSPWHSTTFRRRHSPSSSSRIMRQKHDLINNPRLIIFRIRLSDINDVLRIHGEPSRTADCGFGIF